MNRLYNIKFFLIIVTIRLFILLLLNDGYYCCCYMIVFLHLICLNAIFLLQRQFVLIHIIRQTEIPALLDGWFANTTSVKIFILVINQLHTQNLF